MHQALSFPTSHQLLKSVEDKVVKFCLKNGHFSKIFAAISEGATESPSIIVLIECINRITGLFFPRYQAIYPVFPGSLTLISRKTVRFRRLCNRIKNVLEQLSNIKNNNILILLDAAKYTIIPNLRRISILRKSKMSNYPPTKVATCHRFKTPKRNAE